MYIYTCTEYTWHSVFMFLFLVVVTTYLFLFGNGVRYGSVSSGYNNIAFKSLFVYCLGWHGMLCCNSNSAAVDSAM